MNPLEGVTTNWGFSGGDVWSTVMLIMGALAAYFIIGAAVSFAKIVIRLVYMALNARR